MTKILLYSWAGMGNIGDDWLLSRSLIEFGAENCDVLAEPHAQLSFLSDSMRVVRWPPFGDGPKVISKFRDMLADYDVVILCGGGWLAGDQGLRTPSRWAYRLAILPRHVEVWGMGLGVGPFPGGVSSALGRKILGRFTQLSVRTRVDADWVKRISGRSPQIFGDLCISTPSPGRGSQLPGSGSTLVLPRPSAHWWKHEPREFENYALRLADELAPTRWLLFDSGDVRAGVHQIAPSSVDGALRVIGESSRVVTGRLHAAIAAVVAGVPLCAFGYHHKFDLLSDLGVPVRQIDDHTSPVSFVTVDDSVLDEAVAIQRGHLQELHRCLGETTTE